MSTAASDLRWACTCARMPSNRSYIIMAYKLTAYIVMAYIVMAFVNVAVVAVAYLVMVNTAVAYIVWPMRSHQSRSHLGKSDHTYMCRHVYGHVYRHVY